MLYLYRPDANDFAGLGFSLVDHARIIDVHFTDLPLAERWVAPIAHGFADDVKKEGDFPSLTNYDMIPVMTQRAWTLLRPVIGSYCEPLPIVHPSRKPYFIVHVMYTVDCLDLARSVFTRNPTTGRINRIHRYALESEMLRGAHMFKLPLECGAELLVDEEFREAVQANGMGGLQFKEISIVD
jgi:hypothetical protein